MAELAQIKFKSCRVWPLLVKTSDILYLLFNDDPNFLNTISQSLVSRCNVVVLYNYLGFFFFSFSKSCKNKHGQWRWPVEEEELRSEYSWGITPDCPICWIYLKEICGECYVLYLTHFDCQQNITLYVVAIVKTIVLCFIIFHFNKWQMIIILKTTQKLFSVITWHWCNHDMALIELCNIHYGLISLADQNFYGNKLIHLETNFLFWSWIISFNTCFRN
jgi:hypothetical protein